VWLVAREYNGYCNRLLAFFINNMQRIKFILGSLFGVLAFAPALAFAATSGDVPLTSLGSALESLMSLMNMVVPLLIGLAVIAFLWGVLKFVFNAGDEEKRKEGKMFMIYGLVGIVVMVSVWGLVGFIQNTFGLQSGNRAQNTTSLLP